MVVSRCGDLSRFFAPLCISREYLTRKGKGGKVGEEFEELLENLLIMPRNRCGFCDFFVPFGPKLN